MKPSYHLLYNQDATNLFAVTQEPIEPCHVDRMVDEVADGGADVFLVNPNAQRVNYASNVWQTFWDGYAPGRREFFGPVKNDEVAGREHLVAQMKRLADQGCDYVARTLARARVRGVVPGISVRMNDMHDQPSPGTNLHSRYYMEHPEYHLANPAHLGWGATGLNYAFPEVQEHSLALIRELVQRYDFEVLELDFLRFANYFPRDGAFDRYAAIMTTFVRAVRRLLDDSGRKITLTTRVASTPAAAYELGMDVGTWAREKLVDGISAGLFLTTGWNVPVDAFRKRVGQEVAVYVSCDFAADCCDGYPMRELPTNELLLKGFAAAYLAAGMDGLEMFNFFCARETTPPQEPRFDVLKEMKDLARLRRQPKTYLTTTGTSCMETDGPTQVPVSLTHGQSRLFQMLLARETEPMNVEILVLCEGEVACDRLWLQLNEQPLGPARSKRQDFPNKRSSWTVAFSAPSATLHDGLNSLVLRNEGELVQVINVEVNCTAP